MDYAGKRAVLEAQISELREQASAAAARLYATATQCVRDASAKGVDDVVRTQPVVTQGLGSERLRQLKSDLKAIDGAAEEVVRIELDKIRHAWTYRIDEAAVEVSSADDMNNDFRSYHRFGASSLPRDLDVALNGCLKPVSDALYAYGYEDRYGQRGAKRGLLVGLPVTTTEDLHSAVVAYSSAADGLHGKRLELARLNVEEAQADAKSLWDNA